MMQPFESQRAEDGTEDIRHPIVDVISHPTGGKGLVIFIERANQTDRQNHDGQDDFPFRRNRFAAEKEGAQ